MTSAARRRLGVMFIGVGGAVASTAIAGALAIRRQLAAARGMVTEGPDCAGLDLVPLDALRFSGWDLDRTPLSQRALRHGVLGPRLLEPVSSDLDGVVIRPGIATNLDRAVRQLARGSRLPKLGHAAAVERLRADIAAFRAEQGAEDVVVVCCASTDRAPTPGPSHADPARFEQGLREDAAEIGNGMLYGYAALAEGCPFVNFTPNTTVEIPALLQLAIQRGVPLAGRDGKTGQTLYKTVLAPMLRARQLTLTGWYSTNILGNTDGLVLEDPAHGAVKVHSKEGVLEAILGYADFVHRVRIDYYPPRADAKEAWDCVDFEGWLGTPMSMRINWLGSDSILAAPLVLDLVRLVDLARRRRERGPLPHLAMFFKDPYETAEHDFFRQVALFEAYVARSRSGAPG